MDYACGDCVYFDSVNSYCRCHAPAAALTGSSKVIWPQVDPVNDWCGEGRTADTGEPFVTAPPSIQQRMPVTGKKA